jgi:hypothetical protein
MTLLNLAGATATLYLDQAGLDKPATFDEPFARTDAYIINAD